MTIQNPRLVEGIVFGNMPFCGVLVNTRDFNVVRISARASSVLAELLYQDTFAETQDASTARYAENLVQQLASNGFLTTGEPAQSDQ